MNKLQIEIGTEEAITLKPLAVRIQDIEVIAVGEKNSEKVVCTCFHPDNDDPIRISSVKIENKGKLEVVGLWFNLDSGGKIRKGSALAKFLEFMRVKNIEALKGRSLDTVVDDKGYLSFKAY
jgi:hypothetical protein